jgi:hypothetical protein
MEEAKKKTKPDQSRMARFIESAQRGARMTTERLLYRVPTCGINRAGGKRQLFYNAGNSSATGTT